MRSWNRDSEVISHIKNEELGNKYPAACCGVVLKNEMDLDCHLADVHSLNVKVHALSSPMPEDEIDDKSDGFLALKDEMNDHEEVHVMSQTEVTVKEAFRGETLPSSMLLDANSPSFSSDWSALISQTPSSDLVGSGGPPDSMWDYILFSPRLPSDNFSNNDGHSQQSLAALHSPLHLDISSPDTTPEPMTPEEFSRGSPSPQLYLDCSDAFDHNPPRPEDGTSNALADLVVSPK